MQAACIPLPTAEYRALDRAIDDQPEHVLAEVEKLLADTAVVADPRRSAELSAVAAEAAVQASGPEAVKAHVDAGLARLQHLSAGPIRASLETRLQSTRAIQSVLVGESGAALQVLGPLLAAHPSATVERSCLLAARSLVHLQSRLLGDAAADAMESYETANALGADYARMNAAYHLAAIYSRAGMAAEAEKMVGAVIDYAGQERLLQLQTIAAFLQARVLNAAGEYDKALVAARRARELAMRSGSETSIAAATVSVCGALVEQREFAEAASLCDPIEPVLRRTQRRDLVAEVRAQRARIQLAAGHAREARSLLDAVLAADGTPLGPSYIARYLRYRVDADEALHDWRGAVADLRRAEDLERQALAQDRVNAAAVIGATTERVRWIASQRDLQARLDGQRREIAAERRMRNRSLAFAGVAASLVALLALFLRQLVRQRRESRRQEATLGAVVQHAPDALLLLDPSRRVRYANRNLSLAGPTHVPGRPLLPDLDESIGAALRALLDSVETSRQPMTTVAWTSAPSGQERQLELQVIPVESSEEFLGVLVRGSDVSAAHRLEREVVEASNRERLQTSRRLHEGLSQQLTGVALLAKGLLSQLDRGGSPSREALAEISQLLGEGVGSLRQLARDLSPVAVERGSLGDALRRLAGEFGDEHDVAVDVAGIEAGLVVGDEAADHLYRIAREAVSLQAASHRAGARIALALRREAGRLRLQVDGQADFTNASDFGLRLAEYRAHLLGGSLEVTTEPGGAHRLGVAVPWERVVRT